ncbi:hypothetical protein PHSY_000533 [Pseudozyma hubeiensis SY62]|uniref:Uncharacterized protein n=1 Tax=Pseudozyma hubeiensis (strain SY62) TaxID=1305764 RepID=R9NWI4_PSEHS|nr:hypothetical protein PHSY_000533 [Pseudozyma hubeiensis SY62]GAC92973.1 hypothetical protein PHSY_000533 [Pseudozyma hubeiensis SY62]
MQKGCSFGFLPSILSLDSTHLTQSFPGQRRRSIDGTSATARSLSTQWRKFTPSGSSTVIAMPYTTKIGRIYMQLPPQHRAAR